MLVAISDIALDTMNLILDKGDEYMGCAAHGLGGSSFGMTPG
jgi:hypothetical protein